MAVTLTKSYQKISTISLTYGEIRTYAKYTSQNSTTNKTTYYLKSTYYTSYSTLSFSSATAKLDGTSKNYGSTTLTSGETTLQEVSRTITHNTNGTSPEKTVKTEWTATFGGSGSKSATIKMPTINRIATITSAPNFNDEGNPTINYSNPAGNSVSSLQVCIASTDGTTFYANYRDVSKTGASYTFNLTEIERNNLRLASKNNKTFDIKFYIKTVINGETHRNSVVKTLTIINATPTEITTFLETNQKVIELLGSSLADTIIQNVSSLKSTSTPTVLKGATVSKIQFQHNNVSVAKTSSPYEYTFTPVNSIFKTTITDSRGYVVSNEYTKDIIEYLPIDISSFSFKRVNPTSSDIVLNAQIRYKQATFGESDNVPTIQWKCGENGELNTLTAENYTLDTENNRIIISNLTLSDILPYTQESRFYLYASDLLTEDTENEPVLKGIPTCDMGEHDFQVNGDLFIADKNRENKVNVGEILKGIKPQKVLWSGAYYMNGSQSIALTEKISEQTNGVVLIWSAYSNGSEQDFDFAMFFIPKIFVSLFPGYGVDMSMSHSALANYGSKYCYIGDQKITGHNNNAINGTGSTGIKYTNKYWVLRAVVGV